MNGWRMDANAPFKTRITMHPMAVSMQIGDGIDGMVARGIFVRLPEMTKRTRARPMKTIHSHSACR